MNKKSHYKNFINKSNKIISLVLLCCIVCLSGTYAGSNNETMQQIIQQKRITLELKNKPIKVILQEIKKQSEISFMFKNEEDLSSLNNLSISVKNETVEHTLKILFTNTNFTYVIVGDTINIVKKEEQKVSDKKITANGIVVDKNNKPIIGATIIEIGTTNGGISTETGHFIITATESAKIEIACVGYRSQIIPLTNTDLKIKLEEDVMAVSDVVVTGIYTRKADSFTGSYSTFNAKDLKAIGNTNVLQSLKTLDPSFNIIESNEFGSDPNRLPDIEIRGKSSMLGMRDAFAVDPNQPLFILDGFETTLSIVNNLDMNRVAGITILKDAASTAIYGSKAANGVVVIETIRPTAGKLRINYNGSMNISIPDLSSYNLMNSKEKLDFERLAGVYNGNTATLQQLGLEKYNRRLGEVLRGVDTYWLADPLRVGINHRNSLYVEGGDGGFTFAIGGNYNGVTGVMKDSQKEVIGGNIDITYQIKKFRFSNKFAIDYETSKDPLVSFSSYANANPYYTKYNDDGTVKQWLEVYKDEQNKDVYIPNPMYNASLNSRNKGKSLSLANNFNAEYRPIDNLMIRARLGLRKMIEEQEEFVSPDHSNYIDKQILDRGDYNYTNGNTFAYDAELTVSYAATLNKIHSFSITAGGNLNSSSRLNNGYTAHGFPSGDFTYPSFASGYGEGNMPIYYNSESRAVSAYLNGGYSLMNKYLFDVSYRLNGSSVFGSSKRYTNTWALGLAWNIHNEKFIRNWTDGISLLKIRASIGNPGNQNFDSFMTFSTYKYDYNSFNYFGMSSFMNSLGNSNLEWQTTIDKNIGFDLSILKNRLTINADFYHKKTDPLLITISTPSSTGTKSVTTNLGNQVSQGFSATVLGYVIYRPEDNFTMSIRANLRTETAKLGGIGNKLESLNKYGQTNKTLVRYYDGANPNDLWAVKSLGIDPATGREIYLYKDGSKSFDYSLEQEQIVGNTRPKAEGIIGASFRYKGFTADINFRYRLGADLFNTAVFEKVENVGSLNNNQDKRAYYERWQKPGDVAKYRDISAYLKSPISSRFVQRENTFSLESLRVGYEFPSKKGLLIKVDAYMSEVFRASTILSERGTSYPFARSFQLALTINF